MNKQIIKETFEKIEKTLNLRFEDNSALYISKENTEKIKESLSKNNFQNIFGLAQKHGDEIVAKVILKNSWLIDFQKIKKNRSVLSKFSNLFKNISNSFFIQIAEPIIDDKFYSSIEFKQFVEEMYYNKIDKNQCEKIYSEKDKKPENRCICFVRYLKEVYVLEESSTDVVRFINMDFASFPEIYKYLNSKKNTTLQGVFMKTSDKYSVANWIIENKIEGNNEIIKGNTLWKNGLLSLGTGGLKAVIEYVSAHPTYDNDNTKFMIRKIIPSFYKNDNFEDSVLNLYQNYFHIRILLIQMLSPSKFKSKEIAQDLINKFEQIEPFRPNWIKSVDAIRNWEERVDKFNSVTEILEKVNNPTTNLSNKKTQQYFSLLLSKSEFSIIKELHEIHGTDENVYIVLTHFLVNLFNGLNDFKKIDPFNKLDLSEKYITRISNYIGEMYINTKEAKKFLEENKQYTILEQLNRR